MAAKIPRSQENDYTRRMAETWRRFLSDQTGVELGHLGQHSFDPSMLRGNIEHFIGAAQVDVLLHARQISSMGAFLTGANNNGSHSSNAITALFIATWQDVANVSESSAAVLCGELSLGAAVVADEWVSSHERLGRNRP
jgi:hydroxymethylglutaryl-CoA reductase